MGENQKTEPAHKDYRAHIRCGVCVDTFSARMIRQHNDANMLSIGARVVGEGLALDIVDAFLNSQFEGGRHATRVEMIGALEG
jgi:ribose 5-phosphate isomerase B